MDILFCAVTLIAVIGDFAGFFVQARTENNSDSLNSIVGTWTPMMQDNPEAATVPCNGRADVSTH